MTKESFAAMITALMNGNNVELIAEKTGKVTQARLARSGEHFEIATPMGWRSAPLGAAGHSDWRFPSEKSYVG